MELSFRKITVRPAHPVNSSTSNRDWSKENALDSMDKGSLAFADPALIAEVMELMEKKKGK